MTNMPLTIPTPRFSRLPLYEACPASFAEAAGKPSPSGEAATFGTKGHALLAGLVKGQELPQDADPEVVEALMEGDVDTPGKVKALLDSLLPKATWDTELDVNIAGVNGSCDVFGKRTDMDVGAILDWKFENTNFQDVDGRIQVLGYGAAIGTLLGLERVEVAAYNVTIGKLSTTTMDRDRMKDIRNRIDAAVLLAKSQLNEPVDRRKYAPGEHCGFCPGRIDCPALAAIRKEALVLFDPRAGLPDIPREKYPLVYEQWQRVRRAGESFADLVRADIKASGPIQDETRWLGLNTRMVTPRKSWDSAKELLIEYGASDLVAKVEAALSARPKAPQQALHLGKIEKKS